MDKRIEKTKTAIKHAYIELYTNKSLHKITVKELCEKANINKSTFYVHYKDIYHLDDSLKKEAISTIIHAIPHVQEYTFDNPADYTKEITVSFAKYRKLTDKLFSQEDIAAFGNNLEIVMKKSIFEKHPHLAENERFNIMLSYCIHGAYHAQLSNQNIPFDTILDVITDMVETLQPMFKELPSPEK